MGEAVVNQLVSKKIIKSFADIYSLAQTDLAQLELFKEKKISNLLEAIAASKKRSLSRLIYALGIRHVGEKAAMTLANNFKTMDALREADKESLVNILEIGPVMAESIYEFFRASQAKKLIAQLKQAGYQ